MSLDTNAQLAFLVLALTLYALRFMLYALRQSRQLHCWRLSKQTSPNNSTLTYIERSTNQFLCRRFYAFFNLGKNVFNSVIFVSFINMGKKLVTLETNIPKFLVNLGKKYTFEIVFIHILSSIRENNFRLKKCQWNWLTIFLWDVEHVVQYSFQQLWLVVFQMNN